MAENNNTESSIQMKCIIDLLKKYTRTKSDFEEKNTIEINPFDFLKLRETDHSKILATLLNIKRGKFYILESFLRFIGKSQESFSNLTTVSPKVLTEFWYVDVSILDRDYCLLIENKVKNANDQESQLARYIEGKLNSSDYKEEQIYIIYLSADNSKCPSNQAWERNGKNYQQSFANRYIHLTIKDHICLWLKELLNEIPTEEYQLRNFISQYESFWEKQFSQSKYELEMNTELKSLLTQSLGLNNTNKEEALEIVKRTRTDLEQMKTSLIELHSDIYSDSLDNEFKKIAKTLQNKYHTSYLNIGENKPYRQVGIKMKYPKTNETVTVMIERHNYQKEMDQLYYGVNKNNRVEGNESVYGHIKTFLGEYKGGWFYYKQSVQIECAEKNLIELIDKMEANGFKIVSSEQ